jgi:hypothetical protein
MSRRSDTKALASRDPANKPDTHAIMTVEYFNGASTYRQSMDRQGMSLSIQKGSLSNPAGETPGRFEKSIAEENDRPSDVSMAINGSQEGSRGYGRQGRPGMQDGPKECASGTHMKGYGR